MLLRSLTPFLEHPQVAQIVVALPSKFVSSPPEWLVGGVCHRVKLVEGGPSRAASVKAALDVVDPSCKVVLVHDAARPFVSSETISSVIEASRSKGSIAAVPVSDTIKRIGPDGHTILETVDRNDLWRAQTPQGCPLQFLIAAYDMALTRGGWEGTDEASLLEYAGYQVTLVADLASNFKITTEADFLVAEALASQ